MKWFKRKPKASEAVPHEEVTRTAGSLREFVYLDEVSVYSLTSAPDLPPPVTISESASRASGETLRGQLEAGGPVLAKANLGSEFNSSRSGGWEVQRQFNIQSQFARLHKLYGSSFLLSAGTDGVTKEIKRTDDLALALDRLSDHRRAVRSSDFTRGALAEMRVALRAHHMFDVTAFIKTAGNLIEKYPSLLGVRDMAQVANGLQAGELFAELMEDLIPIEGRATAYRVIRDHDDERWIVDLDVFKVTYTGDRIPSDPLRVVGVAENESFWKDTRRILHSDSEFDVLGRVARTGLQTDWTPVKVVDTFKRVMPSAADGILEGIEMMRNLASRDTSSTEPGTALLLAGTTFHQQLASHHDVTTPGPSVLRMATLLEAEGTLSQTLTSLNGIADDFYSQNPGLQRDEEAVAALRQDALRSGHQLAAATVEPPEVHEETLGDPAIELEFIAMYW